MPEQNVQWTDEIIRQRGVRAVVAAMRLKKQCQELPREHRRYLEEIVHSADDLNIVNALHQSVRRLYKVERSKKSREGGYGSLY